MHILTPQHFIEVAALFPVVLFSFGHCVVCPSSICSSWLSVLVSSSSFSKSENWGFMYLWRQSNNEIIISASFVYQGYQCCLFLSFWNFILELFQQCGFYFYFIIINLESALFVDMTPCCRSCKISSFVFPHEIISKWK